MCRYSDVLDGLEKRSNLRLYILEIPNIRSPQELIKIAGDTLSVILHSPAKVATRLLGREIIFIRSQFEPRPMNQKGANIRKTRRLTLETVRLLADNV